MSKKKYTKKSLIGFLIFAFLVIPFSVSAILLRQDLRQHAAAPNTSVNFTVPTTTLPSYAFSSTISTYGIGGNIVGNATQRNNLKSLGLGLYRIPLQWNGGNIVSAAGGGPKEISGDIWVTNIKALGGIPMIVLGGSADNNFTPTDGANMVRHFTGNNKVTYWVIGNEPGNGGMSIETYCTLFNQTVDAMKAVDPTIKVAGPAWAFYDANTLQKFLQCAGNKVDIIDYHHYGMGGDALDNATALSQTQQWEDEVRPVRQQITAAVPARANQIEIHVGEYNWSWRTADGYAGWNGDDRFYQSVATVWGASVAGHIAKAGGRGFQYADQNGALGITFEKTEDATHFGKAVADPMPIYHGLRMFSGGDLFRKFGAQFVEATTTLPQVEIFASTNDKNIVLINKNPTTPQTASIQLTGFTSGTVEIWQTNNDAPFAAPTKKDPITIGATFDYILPPYSVTTMILSAGGTAIVPTTAQPLTPTLYCLGSCPTAPVIEPTAVKQLLSQEPTTVIPSQVPPTELPTIVSAITPSPVSSPGESGNKQSLLQQLLELILRFFMALANLFRY